MTGTVGNRTDQVDELIPKQSNNRFYLNINAPATANGTVSAIQYCYIVNVTDFEPGKDIFLSTIGFYRPEGNTYTLINSIVIRFDNLPADITDCVEMSVPEFHVEEGDVIGVCLNEFTDGPIDTRRISMFGDVRGLGIRYSIWRDMSDLCQTRGVMPLEVGRNELVARLNRVILVFANITSK